MTNNHLPNETESTADEFLHRPVFRRFGMYFHFYLIAGLALPILIYLTMMHDYCWRMPTLDSSRVVGFTSPKRNVLLYASPQTKNLMQGMGGNYDVLLMPWRQYLKDRNQRFKETSELKDLRDAASSLLILPSAIALSTEERQAIELFRSQGGAVLATWAAGSRDAKGDWQGWQFLESLGARVLGELNINQAANHLILNGNSALSHHLPAGQRLYLAPTSESLLRLQGDMVAGRITNWTRVPQAAQRSEGGVIYTETSASIGRSVVLAFAESTWADHPKTYYSFFDDVFRWLSREPSMIQATWPHHFRAAQVVEMDTEEGFPNAENFGSMLKAVNIPAAFYVLTSVGIQYPEVLKRLHRDFEVGYHGDIHTGFKDESESKQFQRLQTMKKQMQSVIPDTRRMVGFRAPTEGYDATTEQILHQLGLGYHVADPNRTEGRLPLFAKIDGTTTANDLVVLPRTQRDDINFNQENLGVEQTTQAMIQDAELLLENGGLGILSVHSQNFAADSLLARAFPGFLLYLKQNQQQFWLASPRQVVDWWRARENVKMSAEFDGVRMALNISVVGNDPIQGVTFIAILPRKGIVPNVKPLKVGGLKPQSVQLLDPYRAAISFDTLKPGHYSYQVTFDPS